MDKIIDLDSLMPQTITVRMGGVEHKVNPPTVAQILVLVQLNSDLMDADSTNYEEKKAASDKVQAHLRTMIEGLPEGDLGAFQHRRLIEILLELSRPEEMQALTDKGITVDNSKKAEQD